MSGRVRAKAVLVFQVKQSLLGKWKIKFTCPHCGSQLTSERVDIGRADVCPACHQQFGIPQKAEDAIQRIELERQETKDQKLRDVEAKVEAKRAADIARMEAEATAKEEERQEANRRKLIADQNRQRVEAEKKKRVEEPAKQLNDCPDCGESVSKRAEMCPHCGCPLRGKAVECRLTLHRTYQNEGSLRTSYVSVGGRELLLETGGSETMLLKPGRHRITFSLNGLLGKSLQESVNIDITEGDHIIIDFNPFAGFFSSSFGYDISRKLD